MEQKRVNAPGSLLSPRLARAYQAAQQRVVNRLTGVIRNWEKQSIQHRKWQLVLCLATLLSLGSLSVYFTATGHFFTRITQKQNEQQPNAGPLRRH